MPSLIKNISPSLREGIKGRVRQLARNPTTANPHPAPANPGSRVRGKLPHPSPSGRGEHGFTLVELSIVLVIIGLLIGGILAAQSMIGTAKIQAQVRQLQQFDVAVTNFHTKFNQIPGDCSICDHITNGNAAAGDGIIEDGQSYCPGFYMNWEALYFFIDLSSMNIITDNYNIGTVPGAQFDWGVGKQYPAGAIRGGLFINGMPNGNIFYTFVSITAPPAANDPFYINHIKGNFSAAEVLAIDTKIDDGNPATGDVDAIGVQNHLMPSGSILPFDLDTTSCTVSGKYNTSNSATNLCNIVVKSQFH